MLYTYRSSIQSSVREKEMKYQQVLVEQARENVAASLEIKSQVK
jgi:hypothetical protein